MEKYYAVANQESHSGLCSLYDDLSLVHKSSSTVRRVEKERERRYLLLWYPTVIKWPAKDSSWRLLRAHHGRYHSTM